MGEFYNLRLSFKGDGSFKFVLGPAGEVTLYNGRDIYVMGVSVRLIEKLRVLKGLGLDIIINGKSDGCAYSYDLSKYSMGIPTKRVVPETNPIVDLNAIYQSGEAGPIEEDKKEEEFTEEPVKEDVKEDVKEELKLDDYKISTEKSSSFGKKLSELSDRSLKGMKRFCNDEDKKAIEEYLDR